MRSSTALEQNKRAIHSCDDKRTRPLWSMIDTFISGVGTRWFLEYRQSCALKMAQRSKEERRGTCPQHPPVVTRQEIATQQEMIQFKGSKCLHIAPFHLGQS